MTDAVSGSSPELAAVVEPAPPVPPSPAAQLQDAFWRLKRRRIRVSNTHTTRASSIGDPCERRLFYERTAHELAVPHGPALQAIFEDVTLQHLETVVFNHGVPRNLQVVGNRPAG